MWMRACSRRSSTPAMMIATLLLAGLAAAPVAADPPSIGGLAGVSDRPDDNDRQRIRTYADFWGARLVAGAKAPEDVKRVRQQILSPLVGPRGATEIFRVEYGRALDPHLEKVLQEGNAHTTVNASIILTALGTEDALRTLLGHVDVRREDRRHVRLAAARGTAAVLAGDTLPPSIPRKIIRTSESLLDAVGTEPDGLTIQYLLLGLLAAESQLDEPGNREAQTRARELVVQGLDRTVERALAESEYDQAKDYLAAVLPVVKRARDSYVIFLASDESGARSFGAGLAPVLHKVLESAQTHWASAHDSPEQAQALSQLIGLSEGFMGLIDSVVRSRNDAPRTALRRAWDQRDLEKYRADVQTWQTVLRSYR